MVGISTFHGGEVGHRRKASRRQAQPPQPPWHSRIKAFDHHDSEECKYEKQPLRAMNPFVQKKKRKQDREYWTEILNHCGTGQRNVLDGMKEPSQAKHSRDSSQNQPSPVVPQK